MIRYFCILRFIKEKENYINDSKKNYKIDIFI